MDKVENQINDLEYKEAKNNQSEQEKKESTTNKDRVSGLWENFSVPTFAS